jgi:hypothetical protein
MSILSADPYFNALNPVVSGVAGPELQNGGWSGETKLIIPGK